VQRSAENHADGTAPECDRRTPEQRVDRRPVAVLARTARHRHAASQHRQVKSRGRDINPASLDRIAIPRLARRKVAGPLENLRQHAADPLRQMQRNENGGWKVRLNVLDETLQRANPAGRCADHDDIEVRHTSPAARRGTWPREVTIPVLV
jgi:hypothetical protein